MQSPHPWQIFGSTIADSSASIRKMALTGHAVAAGALDATHTILRVNEGFVHIPSSLNVCGNC